MNFLPVKKAKDQKVKRASLVCSQHQKNISVLGPGREGSATEEEAGRGGLGALLRERFLSQFCIMRNHWRVSQELQAINALERLLGRGWATGEYREV